MTQKELAAWWASIAIDPRFDRVLLHASGVALESIPSAEQRAGVLAFKEILLTLSDKDSEPVQFSAPAMKYDLDVQRRIVHPPEVKQPDKPKKK